MIYRSNRFLSKVQKLSLMVIVDNKRRCTNKVSGGLGTGYRWKKSTVPVTRWFGRIRIDCGSVSIGG